MKKITHLYLKLLICAAAALQAVILHLSGIGCVWRYFLGIRCPACGMTSAYLALMRLDISEAFRCHPMFWSVPVILWYIFRDGRPIRNKFVNTMLIACIGAGFIICYAVKGVKL